MLDFALPVEQVVGALLVLLAIGALALTQFINWYRHRQTIRLQLDHEYRLKGRQTPALHQPDLQRPLTAPELSAEKLAANLEAIRRTHQPKPSEPVFTSSPPSVPGPIEITSPSLSRVWAADASEYEMISPVPEPIVSPQTPETTPPPDRPPVSEPPARITVEKPVLFEELEGHTSLQRSLLVATPAVGATQPPPPPSSSIIDRPSAHVLPESVGRVPEPASGKILDIPKPVPPAGMLVTPSVIDVTGQSARIPTGEDSNGLIKYPRGVPPWEHEYVYSYSELEYATLKQQDFYSEFRKTFFRGEHYNLEGNTNYAFILLFDLVESYNHISDLPRVERQLERLGEFYPKTRTYIRSSLYDHMNEIGDAIGIEKYQPIYEYGNRSNWEDQWLLGNKHKKRLGLSDAEAELLNKIPYQRNVFLDIPFCGDEVMRLYLRVASKLEKHFEGFGTPLATEIAEVYDIIARKHFRYRKGSANYREVTGSGETDLLDVLFRYCENAVREKFGNKRKRNIDQPYSGEAQVAFEDRFVSKLPLLIEFEVGDVKDPDRATEIVLNAQNPTRWKSQLDTLKETVQQTSSREFVDSVIELEKLNEHNQARENIYFEASKFMVKSDRNAALELFVRYVDCDLRSDKFDNKKLTKTVQKNLFASPEQVREFERIIDGLIRTKDLNNALTEVSQLYAPKRKRIELSTEAIRDARVKHSGTVELLNEYLQDEEPGPNLGQAEAGEIELRIPAAESVPVARRSTAIELKADQYELLEKFEMSGFALDHQDVEAFALARGLFKNQLIEGVNEACYEWLDDVLIEEEDDGYVVDQEYFNKIFTA